MISPRNTVLSQLETDLALINGTGVYTADIQEIKRGIYHIDDFDAFPAVSFWCENDEVEERLMGNTYLRELSVYMFGYAAGVSEVTAIHQFEEDVEYFLDNDFTYSNNVLIDNVILYEKGTISTTDDAAMFLLNFRIKYEK